MSVDCQRGRDWEPDARTLVAIGTRTAAVTEHASGLSRRTTMFATSSRAPSQPAPPVDPHAFVRPHAGAAWGPLTAGFDVEHALRLRCRLPMATGDVGGWQPGQASQPSADGLRPH